MYKYVSLLAILATFFACKTTNVSSNTTPEGQLKEEWVFIEEGETAGKYEGRLWGFRATKEIVTEGSSIFSIYTVTKDCESEREGEKVFTDLVQKAEIKLRGYGPTYQRKHNGGKTEVYRTTKPGEGRTTPSYYSRVLDISVISEHNSKIRSRISFNSSIINKNKRNMVNMTMILPVDL